MLQLTIACDFLVFEVAGERVTGVRLEVVDRSNRRDITPSAFDCIERSRDAFVRDVAEDSGKRSRRERSTQNATEIVHDRTDRSLLITVRDRRFEQKFLKTDPRAEFALSRFEGCFVGFRNHDLIVEIRGRMHSRRDHRHPIRSAVPEVQVRSRRS